MLDLPTLIIISGSISLLQFLSLGIVGIYNRTVKGIYCWAVAALLNGVAMPLISLRSFIDSALLTKLLPTSMNFAATYLFYLGAVRFRGDCRPRHWPLLALLPCYVTYAWLILQDEGLRYRPLLTSSIFVCFLAQGAWVMLKETQEALRFSSRLMGICALLIAAVFAYRAVALFVRDTPAELLDQVMPQLITFSGIILWTLAWNFGAMMLINQRQTFDNARLHAEKLRSVQELAAAENVMMELRTAQHRQQLTSDLHDGFSGITSNLAMLAFQGCSEERLMQQKELFQKIESLATEWNRELRLWMNGMERGSLYWADTLAEAKSYAQRLTAAKGISLHWRLTGQMPDTPENCVQEIISLMRVLKEAINNLVSHSNADHAQIHVAFRDSRMAIVVKDDGHGFQTETPQSSSRGLKNMERRINELSGTLKRRNKWGTVLCITIPLPLQSNLNQLQRS